MSNWWDGECENFQYLCNREVAEYGICIKDIRPFMDQISDICGEPIIRLQAFYVDLEKSFRKETKTISFVYKVTGESGTEYAFRTPRWSLPFVGAMERFKTYKPSKIQFETPSRFGPVPSGKFVFIGGSK